MGYFPFFIDIKGKPGLIVGGGKIAAHKVEKLLPFEPKLFVAAPVILQELLDNPLLGCQVREFADEDVEGKEFVIAASDDKALNLHVAKLCRQKHIPVNVADNKKACTFLFPSLVKEGKLTVGISTEGASPQAAASIRSQVAQALPGRMEEILDYLSWLRGYAGEHIADSESRAEFLKAAALLSMEKDRALSMEETESLREAYGKQDAGEKPVDSGSSFGKKSGGEMSGSVTLAGAGCGAYDLITVKGLNALRTAQVLVYDELIDERLLSHVPESCEKLYVGKRSGRHSMAQEQINALLVQKAKQGKRVVRLKGGDPFVFGRGGEELLALKKEGVEARLIPGITSSVAVPAAAGIPVTQRGISRSFHVITGHCADQGEEMPENLDVLAKLQGTLVFLMGFGHLGEIARKLVEYGKSRETPAAAVQENFDGSVLAVRGNLGDLAEKVEKTGMKAPAVIVVGETAGMDLLS